MSKIISKAAAALFAACLFTLSACSSDDDKGGEDKYAYCVFMEQQTCLTSTLSCVENGGMLGNTCPADYSKPSSSSGGGGVGNIESVTIGSQVWMKKNLDVEVAGSKCYDDLPANCEKYGRLYDWATAMGLDSECNVTDCSSQVSAKHKGICPSGWHIPSYEEWNALTAYIENDKGCAYCDAKHLKAKSGWNDNGNGLDSYGFAALPSGAFGNGAFGDAGAAFYLWASESNKSKGLMYRMRYNHDENDPDEDVKTWLLSVRCIKDNSEGNAGGVSSSSSAGDGSSSPSGNSEGSHTVNNIGDYRTAEIGDQVWMAENLNYYVAGSRCYDDLPANCEKYGRLYDWATAMGLPENCNFSRCAGQVQAKHKGICPQGWHIPSGNDWQTLMNFVDGTSLTTPATSYTAGGYLKAESGWDEFQGKSGNGEDTYGFSALPGGSYIGGFSGIGSGGDWWSASEDDGGYANYLLMGRGHGQALWNYTSKYYLQSIRCIKD